MLYILNSYHTENVWINREASSTKTRQLPPYSWENPNYFLSISSQTPQTFLLYSITDVLYQPPYSHTHLNSVPWNSSTQPCGAGDTELLSVIRNVPMSEPCSWHTAEFTACAASHKHQIYHTWVECRYHVQSSSRYFLVIMRKRKIRIELQMTQTRLFGRPLTDVLHRCNSEGT